MPVSNANTVSASTSPYLSNFASVDNLTPDGLMLYMQNRLGAVDEQINALLQKQQKADAIRRALGEIQKAKSGLGQEGGTMNKDQRDACRAAFAELKRLDPTMAAALQKDLHDGGCYEPDNKKEGHVELCDEYNANQAAAFEGAVSARMKDLETGAERDMFLLQSLVAKRGMIVNLASSSCKEFSDTLKGQINNI